MAEGLQPHHHIIRRAGPAINKHLNLADEALISRLIASGCIGEKDREKYTGMKTKRIRDRFIARFQNQPYELFLTFVECLREDTKYSVLVTVLDEALAEYGYVTPTTVSGSHETDTLTTVSASHETGTPTTISELHETGTLTTISGSHETDTLTTISGSHETDTLTTISGSHKTGVLTTIKESHETGTPTTISGSHEADALTTISGSHETGALTTIKESHETGTPTTISGSHETGIPTTISGSHETSTQSEEAPSTAAQMLSPATTG